MKRFRSRFSITGAAVLPVMLSFLFASCTADDPASSLPDDYAGWQRTTDLVLNNPIPGHGTGLRVIFINEVGATSAQLPDGSYRYPDGTIVIKEVYATPNPEAGDAPAMLGNGQTGRIRGRSRRMDMDHERPRNRDGIDRTGGVLHYLPRQCERRPSVRRPEQFGYVPGLSVLSVSGQS